jgi:hypothetical protein
MHVELMLLRVFVSMYVHAALLEVANKPTATVMNAYLAFKDFIINFLSLYLEPFSRSHSAGQTGKAHRL